MKNIPAFYENVERWTFGNTDEEAVKLIEMIILGVKTATCLMYEPDGVPQVGDAFVILGVDSEPVCSIEITHVKIATYLTVDREHAFYEGEGDLTLDYWRKTTRQFFEEYDLFSPNMPLVCVRFKLLEVFSDKTNP